jgi:hypothetical protein
MRLHLTCEFFEQLFARVGIPVRLLDHRNERAVAIVVQHELPENVGIAAKTCGGRAANMDRKRRCCALGLGDALGLGRTFLNSDGAFGFGHVC